MKNLNVIGADLDEAEIEAYVDYILSESSDRPTAMRAAQDEDYVSLSYSLSPSRSSASSASSLAAPSGRSALGTARRQPRSVTA